MLERCLSVALAAVALGLLATPASAGCSASLHGIGSADGTSLAARASALAKANWSARVANAYSDLASDPAYARNVRINCGITDQNHWKCYFYARGCTS